MPELDPRIGVYADPSDPKSKTVWPATTVGKRTYTRPATTLNLDKRHFVVLDRFQPEGYQDEIERLRDSLSKTPSVSASAARRPAEPVKKEADGE